MVKHSESDFAFQLGQLMGVMSGLDAQGFHHSSFSRAEWDELMETLTKAANKFYERGYEKEKQTKKE